MADSPSSPASPRPDPLPMPEPPPPDPASDVSRRSSRWKLLLWNLVAISMLFVLLECILYAMLWAPKLHDVAPDFLKHAAARSYNLHDRTLIHGHSQWDPELTYTLRPNSEAVVENREFSMTVRSNRLGLRDDDASLEGPEIIVLGDSFAMGYGTEHGETFAAQVEATTGLKVLNAGLESYGTTRQVQLFNRRLDRSKLRFLVVQYCNNDFEENLSYFEYGANLPTLPEADYQEIVERYLADRRFRPFKYLRQALVAWRTDLKLWFSVDPVDAKTAELLHVRHAQSFLKTLSRLEVPSPDVQLVVLDLWDASDQFYMRRRALRLGLAFDSHLFAQAVRQELAEGDYPELLESMQLVDTSTLITADDFYRIDGHLRPSGHQKIGEVLNRIVQGEAAPALPERDFASTAEERQAQIQTELLPPEVTRSRLDCPQQVYVGAELTEFQIPVEVHNDSPFWWPSLSVVPGAGPIRLRSHLLNLDGSMATPDYPGAVAALSEPVAPGGSLQVDVTVEAEHFPDDDAVLHLDLVQEGAFWFGDHHGQACRVRLDRW